MFVNTKCFQQKKILVSNKSFIKGIHDFQGICISDPWSQFIFSSPDPQLALTGLQPSISIYQPWLIGNNKSQSLHITLLFLFLLSNSFATATGCWSFLFKSQADVRYQFIIIWWGSTCFRNSHHYGGAFFQKKLSPKSR